MTMFSLTEANEGSKSLAIFYSNGESDTIGENHLSFQTVLDLLLSGKSDDESVLELVRVAESVGRRMSQLSERVSVAGNTVYFDGDPIPGELSEVIKELFEQGKDQDFKPLVNFLEKASTNPSLESIDELYTWIRNGDLVIDPDGDIIAYKGLKIDEDGVPASITAGTAFVNGEEFTGNIPNVPGTVITMPRSEVDSRGFVGCSYGLHAGTYGYANVFRSYASDSSCLVLVKINPRDVVSVPTDCQSQKMRVSRYTVLQKIEERISSRVFSPEPVIEGGPATTTVRDSKGRFVKGAQRPRDSKGRYIK